MQTYDYVFEYEGKQIEIVTDSISDAITYLQFRAPKLNFTNLLYFVNMTTGEKTPVYNKRKIFLDDFQKLVKV